MPEIRLIVPAGTIFDCRRSNNARAKITLLRDYMPWVCSFRNRRGGARAANSAYRLEKRREYRTEELLFRPALPIHHELDVLEGPKELAVSLKGSMKVPQKCTKPVPGGTVVATAKDVKAPKEAKLTIRLKFNTKVGERQSSNVYIVSLFP